MIDKISIGLFIAATGFLVWRGSLTKKTVWVFLFSGPVFFFGALYLALEQGADTDAEMWITVVVLFVVFFCLTAGYVNRKLLSDNSPEKLDDLEILFLLLCQPVLCVICRNIFLAGK